MVWDGLQSKNEGAAYPFIYKDFMFINLRESKRVHPLRGAEGEGQRDSSLSTEFDDAMWGPIAETRESLSANSPLCKPPEHMHGVGANGCYVHGYPQDPWKSSPASMCTWGPLTDGIHD